MPGSCRSNSTGPRDARRASDGTSAGAPTAVVPSTRESKCLAFAFEPEHAHAVHAGCLQHLVEALRHSAQVFADDDRPMTVRFQSEQPQEIGRRIGKIGPFRGRSAFRDQPEPGEAHHMVDTHAAGVTQRRAHRGQEGRETSRNQGTW